MKKIISTIIMAMLVLMLCNIENINPAQAERKIIENVNNAESGISVTVELDYGLPEGTLPLGDDLDKNQEIVLKNRKTNREHYKKHNEDFIEKFGATLENIKISEYSPYLFIEFDDYNDYNANRCKIVGMAHNKQVKTIYVEEKLRLDAASSPATGYSTTEIQMEDAKAMINLGNTTYHGNGTKIGILDMGYPVNDTNFYDWEDYLYNDYLSDIDNEPHVDKVASIAAGDYGIAGGAQLFIQGCSTKAGNIYLKEGVEHLLSLGVNVINISLGSDDKYANNGKYDGHSAYLDYIVWSQGVTIVVSAGNKDYLTDTCMLNPSLGTNVISVGSVNAEGQVSIFSLWAEQDNNIAADEWMKPTLVAPGENIIIPNTDNVTNKNGTSFAAPMVTGVVSLLMQEFPRLIASPEIITAALVASATELYDQTELWDTYAGAGLLNYQAARSVLSAGNYISATAPASSLASAAVFSRSVTIPAYSYAEFALVGMHNSEITVASGNIYDLNFSKYTISVRNSFNKPVMNTQIGQDASTTVGKISNLTAFPQTVTFNVSLNGAKVGNYSEYLGFAVYILPHVHEYTQWEYYDNMVHIEKCSCGLTGTLTSNHSVRESEIIDNVAPCLGCGRELDLTTDHAGIIHNGINIKVSINGSYILPSGIAVLVDDDVEAYLAGTLVFYDKDDVPTIA